MKFSLQILAAVVIAAASLSLSSCSAANGSGYSYSNISITITAGCSDCPGISGGNYAPAPAPQPPAAGSILYMAQGGGQGGVYQLTAHVTNAPPASVTWSIFPTPNLTIPNPPPTGTSQPGPGNSAVGSFTTPGSTSAYTATGPVAFYTNTGTPIYTGAALQQAESLGIPQGDVLIVASVPSDPTNPNAIYSVSQLIQIFNGNTTPTLYMSPTEPTTPSGLTSSVAQVPRNGTFQFYGGAVGEQPCATASACLIAGTQYPTLYADNAVNWEVGSGTGTANVLCNTPNAAGQSAAQCPFGWISSTGLYTAPPTIPTSVSPLTGGQVAIVMQSHFLNTITKFAYITVY